MKIPNPAGRRKYGRYNRKGTKRWWHKPAKSGMAAIGDIGLKILKKQLGLNTENKNWDVTLPITPTLPTLTSTLFPMTLLSQGTTNQTRNGNGLRVTHYKFRGVLSNLFANIAHQRVRIIWTLQHKVSTPGSYVLPAQVLQVPTDINSPYNTDLENVKIVSDKTYIIKPYTTQVAQVPIKFKWDPSYDDGHVQWTDADTLGLGVNQLQGLLQMLVLTDQPANQPTIEGYGRIHFVDN